MIEYDVAVSADAVTGRSIQRLAFEPRGWQVAYRHALREGLRRLGSTSTAGGLVTDYMTPDTGRHADLENVLLYNVGAAPFGPLLRTGLTCRRRPSPDGLHHVRYQAVDALPDPGGAQVLGVVSAGLGIQRLHTPAQWWSVLRPYTTTFGCLSLGAQFTLDVTVSGPQLTGTWLANAIKPMLDALVSCFHRHDGSQPDALRQRLSALGDRADHWTLLTTPQATALGSRALLRPFRDGVMWNPADDLCSAFRVRMTHAAERTITATLRAA